MPQPPAYTPAFSFTEDEAANPAAHVPGASLDAEFSAAATTIKAILANLAKLQRDDGALANTIVTLDSLSPAVLLALGGGQAWTPRGHWATGVNYAVGDVVDNGTATYVNSIAHVAAATFAGEPGGAWIKLFDSAGVIPSDNSVSSAKLQPGAVTADKLGFDDLDLTGTGHFGGGVAAGSAPAGALLHGKLAAGNAYGKLERTTDAQGAVGYQIIGVGATWTFEMAAGSNDLALKVGATVKVTYTATGVDMAVPLRVTGGAAPAKGVGTWLGFIGGIGYVTSYDYDAGAWKDLKIRGKVVTLQGGGIDIAQVTSLGLNILPGKTLTLDGKAVGYLGIPLISDNDARTLAAADNGQKIYSKNTGAQVFTIPADMDGDTDFACLIINNGTTAINLNAETGGVVIQKAGGAAANATIAPKGWCFVTRAETNVYFVGGNGTS